MTAKLPGLAALAALVVAVLPARAADMGTTYDTLVGQGGHTVLLVAAKEAGEVAALKGTPPFTLFAPTDAAFKKLDPATVRDIATDTKFVQRLFRTHLVPGNLLAADLRKMNGHEIKTVHGNTLKVEDRKDGLYVGGVKITSPDGKCKNGVIHVIDTVLAVPK